MFRTLGMLTGSVAAIGLLVAVIRLPGVSEPLLEAIPPPVPADKALPAEAIPSPLPDREAPDPPPPDSIQDSEQFPEARPEAPAETATSSAARSEALRWHAFWSPFRSRIAAEGFVAQLSRVTGLDFRVVAVEAGVYEVAFGYAEESEIDARLAAIRAATGIDAGGS